MSPRLPYSLLTLFALLLFAQTSHSETSFSWNQVPKKDVVVFVDVSGSVTPSASAEAGRLVQAIILGTVNPSRFPNWRLDTVCQFPHFQGILRGEAAGDASRGLVMVGQNLSIQKIGDAERVQRGFATPMLIRKLPGSVDEMFSTYPQDAGDFIDQSTYLLLARAKAAQQMLMNNNGDEGFYLFIITDDVNDAPTNYKHDEDALLIERFYRQGEQHRIATILMKDTSNLMEITSGKKTPLRHVPYPVMGKFSIEWYAVGPKAPKALEAPPPPPPPPPPPQLSQWIQLLGGLSKEADHPKVFDQPTPFLAWQLVNGRTTEFSVRVSPVGTDAKVPLSRPQNTRIDLSKNFSANVTRTEQEDGVRDLGTLPLEPLPDGDYKVTIRPKGPSVEDLVVTTYIRISRPFPIWPWIAGLGSLCGAGLFYHMWRALNENRFKKKAA